MRLKQLTEKEIEGFGQTVLFAMALVHTGHNAWVLGGTYDQTYRLCYEHPRGDIESPRVAHKLQFHSDRDGFISPLWSILIDSGIKFHDGRTF